MTDPDHEHDGDAPVDASASGQASDAAEFKRLLEEGMAVVADPGGARSIGDVLRDLAPVVAALVPVGFKVTSGSGVGTPAEVPWLSILPGRSQVQDGVYAVYLFAADGQSVFLSLNQGTEKIKGGLSPLRKRALDIRRTVGQQDLGWQTVVDLKSQASGGRARKYEAASALAKHYSRLATPPPETLMEDLGQLLALCERVLATGLAFDPQIEPIHVLVKWSPDRQPDTIDIHRAIDAAQGSVWWGKVGTPAVAALNPSRLSELKSQLAVNVPTHAYLYRRGDTWRADLKDITLDASDVDVSRMPTYYSTTECVLFLELTNFIQIDPAWPELNLVLANDPDPLKTGGALSNRTSPLIVYELFERSAAEDSRDLIGKMDTWVVRAWSDETLEAFKASSLMAVAWSSLGDLSGMGVEELRDAISAAFAKEPAGTKANFLGQLNQYVNEIREGDLVLSNGSGGQQLLGRVSGAYEYQDQPEIKDHAHTRTVDWITTLDLDGLPSALQNSVKNTPKTVFKLRGLDSVVAKGAGGSTKTEGLHSEQSFAQTLEAFRAQFPTFVISDDLLRRYHVSLRTRGFVIVSGVSGTGKSWLAGAYAVSANARFLSVPVAPNWTSNEDLLGYHNPLDDVYVYTSFTRFLEDAESEWRRAEEEDRRAQMYHLLLDEMNLARVEYYFAKFLSAMEERARQGQALIELGPNKKVGLWPNLAFVGTVNVDETTHGFADKVNDRSQLIELALARGELAAFAGNSDWAQLLMKAWDEVHEVAPFAYRVIDEVRTYIEESSELGTPWATALDEQILQKVLPKIKGADDRVSEALAGLSDLLTDDFPLSRAKVVRLRQAFDAHGFTSFFEF